MYTNINIQTIKNFSALIKCLRTQAPMGQNPVLKAWMELN
jgi:hypothetical protein